MAVKTQFSIKDLENLSNVKAHTIRIWEKRYNLLRPERTDTNIRQYDLLNLKKLLNISLLYNEGHKISKLAKMSEHEIHELILGRYEEENEAYILNAFKTAMLDFDVDRFNITFDALSEHRSFREIFFDFFIPLLAEIGTLWQTGTIDPSHERFISELIKQKIIINTSAAQRKKPLHESPVFVLYLPYEEIHEIGLLYANYEVLSAGYRTVYLGTNIPLSSLRFVVKHHNDIIFLSYFTVKPDDRSLVDYGEEFNRTLSGERPYRLWLMGAKTMELGEEGLKDPNFTVITSLEQLIRSLETLKKS